MPSITINGKPCDFTPGQMIIQVANAAGVEIPQYCYHDGLSIVASCRICLAEVWQPNPRNNNALEPIPKLVPTCQTACADGMVVYTDSPKAVANQKAVMEYLLINHPLDCPVCDQAGECTLQDYSFQYGRGASRFEEAKVKQPKKDVGPHVHLYSDRCIMCTRCVRFTREVTGTGELSVQGRGNQEQIDVFPGVPLDNPLSANVVDLCPVGALLDKDFLFAQRVWFLKETPSIDGLTASGDNIRVDSNDGKVYRIKPRTNMSVNKWWITDEVRYGYKHVHGENRLRSPRRRQFGVQVESDWNRAYRDALDGVKAALASGKSLGVLVSPMLSCEDAYHLAAFALKLDPNAVLGVGPVPSVGSDQTFPPSNPNGFKVYAEKAPNARGVRRVLEAVAGGRSGKVLDFSGFVAQLRAGSIGAAIVTGNYPNDWVSQDLLAGLRGVAGRKAFVVVIDTLTSTMVNEADVVLPASTWLEKAGTFENARGMIQAFEQAIPPVEATKPEAQIALDLGAIHAGHSSPVEAATLVINPSKLGQVPDATHVFGPIGDLYNAADTRTHMAARSEALRVFVTDVQTPSLPVEQTPDMQVVEL